MLQGFGGVIVNGKSVSKKKGCGNGDQSLRDHLTSLDKTRETVTLDKHSHCNLCRKHCDVLKYLPVPIFSQFHVLTCAQISQKKQEASDTTFQVRLHIGLACSAPSTCSASSRATYV